MHGQVYVAMPATTCVPERWSIKQSSFKQRRFDKSTFLSFKHPFARPYTREHFSMRAVHTIAIGMLIGCTSGAAYAETSSTPLTPQQCNDYPFKEIRQPIRYSQIVNQLAELESVGYSPKPGSDQEQLRDLQRAEQRLQAKYIADCVEVTHHAHQTSPTKSDPG
jgi:hypothetical protein